MKTQSPGAPAPLVTAAKAFHLANGKNLLSVNPDVDLVAALDEGVTFAAHAEDLLLSIAQDHDTVELWASIHFMQATRAILNSAVLSLQSSEVTL